MGDRTDAEYVTLWPNIDWYHPAKVTRTSADPASGPVEVRYACRFCLARHGLTRFDWEPGRYTPVLFPTEAEVQTHIDRQHPKE